MNSICQMNKKAWIAKNIYDNSYLIEYEKVWQRAEDIVHRSPGKHVSFNLFISLT